MKNYFLFFALFSVVNANASIEFAPSQNAKPTELELSRSRSCWEELNTLGCGDPGDDPQHFRACLKDVQSSLTASCKSMMKELYGQ